MYEEWTVEMPVEWHGVVPTQIFLDEAKRIVEAANLRGLTLRTLGGLGVRLHYEGSPDLPTRLQRLAEGKQEFTDLDFVTYRKDRDRVKNFILGLDYTKRRATLSSAASERQIYFHPKGWFFVDVFFDKLLVANHPLDFRERLFLDSPTITVSDLLLEKLQIVNPGEKDVKDLVLLLASHPQTTDEQANRINLGYIAGLLSRDWGFWYTVTRNLAGLEEFVKAFPSLQASERQLIADRIGRLRRAIDECPKTTAWKLRSSIGPRKRWYQVVETSETVGEFGIWRLGEKRER